MSQKFLSATTFAALFAILQGGAVNADFNTYNEDPSKFGRCQMFCEWGRMDCRTGSSNCPLFYNDCLNMCGKYPKTPPAPLPVTTIVWVCTGLDWGNDFTKQMAESEGYCQKVCASKNMKWPASEPIRTSQDIAKVCYAAGFKYSNSACGCTK